METRRFSEVDLGLPDPSSLIPAPATNASPSVGAQQQNRAEHVSTPETPEHERTAAVHRPVGLLKSAPYGVSSASLNVNQKHMHNLPLPGNAPIRGSSLGSTVTASSFTSSTMSWTPWPITDSVPATPELRTSSHSGPGIGAVKIKNSDWRSSQNMRHQERERWEAPL